MVKHEPAALDATFAALADPTRRAILARLAAGATSVGHLAQPFAMSLPAVSKHLTVLERAGLIHRERAGRLRRCRLRAGPMRAAADWIAKYRRFWEVELDRLAQYLATTTDPEEPLPWPPADRPPSASASPAPSLPRRRGSSGRGPNRRK